MVKFSALLAGALAVAVGSTASNYKIISAATTTSPPLTPKIFGTPGLAPFVLQSGTAVPPPHPMPFLPAPNASFANATGTAGKPHPVNHVPLPYPLAPHAAPTVFPPPGPIIGHHTSPPTSRRHAPAPKLHQPFPPFSGPGPVLFATPWPILSADTRHTLHTITTTASAVLPTGSPDVES